MKSKIYLFIIAIATSGHVFAEENIQASLVCECIVATGTCNIKLFEEAAGEYRHIWNSEIFYKPSEPLSQHSLNLACWRKRDVVSQGNGLCCKMNDDENDPDRLFRGELE